MLVGGIDASNAVSIKLHESLGFTACGIVRQAGFKASSSALTINR